jgi:hypothetical protein
VNDLGYMTACEHRIWSTLPGECIHGSLTGTAEYPPTGQVFPTLPVEGPVNVSRTSNENGGAS